MLLSLYNGWETKQQRGHGGRWRAEEAALRGCLSAGARVCLQPTKLPLGEKPCCLPISLPAAGPAHGADAHNLLVTAAGSDAAVIECAPPCSWVRLWRR